MKSINEKKTRNSYQHGPENFLSVCWSLANVVNISIDAIKFCGCYFPHSAAKAHFRPVFVPQACS
jgi:hypothetical protein